MPRAVRVIVAWWLLLMGLAILITEIMMASGVPFDGFNPLSWVAVVLKCTYPLPMVLMAIVGVVLGLVLLRRPPEDQ